MKDAGRYEAMQRAIAAGVIESESDTRPLPLWWDDASYIRYQSEDRFWDAEYEGA